MFFWLTIRIILVFLFRFVRWYIFLFQIDKLVTKTCHSVLRPWIFIDRSTKIQPLPWLERNPSINPPNILHFPFIGIILWSRNRRIVFHNLLREHFGSSGKTYRSSINFLSYYITIITYCHKWKMDDLRWNGENRCHCDEGGGEIDGFEIDGWHSWRIPLVLRGMILPCICRGMGWIVFIGEGVLRLVIFYRSQNCMIVWN